MSYLQPGHCSDKIHSYSRFLKTFSNLESQIFNFLNLPTLNQKNKEKSELKPKKQTPHPPNPIIHNKNPPNQTKIELNPKISPKLSCKQEIKFN